ncbi:Glucokinase 1 [Tritrichomonas foetus]|uniref:Glucokinase 1 n=1 Tax=Tritrichomonas foetus TaxID=1144522 RepID=A0A1J4JS13_9EUKA|nr:Glucokinase 1 [Tritrichomonas foetus]|eukprot:OHT00300.1 Glucokinase 1 [Tritrichomonas foetus]
MLSDKLSPMKAWKIGDELKFCLGADVGGSGIRFCLTNFHDQSQRIEPGHMKTKNVHEFYKVISDFSKAIQAVAPGAKCVGSSFACAGLRKGDTVQVMNWSGSAADQTIKIPEIDQTLYPAHHSVMLNDLEAGAYGVVSLSETNEADSYFTKLWGPKGGNVVSKNGHTIVLAMGSGLGAALIHNDLWTNTSVVIPTESGFLLSAPRCTEHRTYNDDVRNINYVSDHYYKGEHTPCFEDLASGRGLVIDYDFLLGHPSGWSAVQIVELAKKGDEKAKLAMKNHYIYFLRCAKQVAYGMHCKSVVMALSNQVANKWLIDEIRNDLEAEFKDTSAWKAAQGISVYSQTKDVNINMIGTNYMAHFAARNAI